MDTGELAAKPEQHLPQTAQGLTAPGSLSPGLPVSLSSSSAWFYLVRLSWSRQARARQMVWIAIGLVVFSFTWVAINTAARGWSMSSWHIARGSKVTFAESLDGLETLQAIAPGAGAGGPAVFSAVIQAILTHSEFVYFSRAVVFSVFISFLLPLLSLSFATEAIGGDREGRNIVWLLSRPLPRSAVYLAKYVAMLPWSLGLTIGGFVLLCAGAGPPGWTALEVYWPAVLCGALAFSSMYCLVGALFRQPAVVAIVYSFFLETILGNMPGYLKRVSISFYIRCMMFGEASRYGVEAEKPTVYLPVDGTTAFLVLIGIAVGFLLLGMIVFSRKEYVSAD